MPSLIEENPWTTVIAIVLWVIGTLIASGITEENLLLRQVMLAILPFRYLMTVFRRNTVLKNFMGFRVTLHKAKDPHRMASKYIGA